MQNIERLRKIWEDIYDPQQDVVSVVENHFHPKYEQFINSIRMLRPEYIDHVIAQKKSMVINKIDYRHHVENGEELFAIYYPKGKNLRGHEVEAEVISYFLFKEGKIIKTVGQVRLIKGCLADVDMPTE